MDQKSGLSGTAEGFRLERVDFSYGSQCVFRNLNLSVHLGRITGILGPNGSGKSTLIKLLSGLIYPQSGTVILGDHPLQSMTIRERAKKIAYVPQNTHFAYSISAIEAVLMGRYPHTSLIGFESAQDIEIACEAMRRTATLDLRNRNFETLSGGERQRIIIASALAQKASILILDEPTAALDVKFQLQILGILRELVDSSDLTAIIAMHDINLCQRYCDDVVLLAPPPEFQFGETRRILNSESLGRLYGVAVKVLSDPRTGAHLFVFDLPEGDKNT